MISHCLSSQLIKILINKVKRVYIVRYRNYFFKTSDDSRIKPSTLKQQQDIVELTLKYKKIKVNLWQKKFKKTDQWAKSNGHEFIEDYVDAGLS